MQTERARYRQAGQQARRDLGHATRARYSTRICTHISRSSLWHACRRIALYFAAPAEADVTDLFEAAFGTGRSVYVPVVGRSGRMRFVRLLPGTPLVRNRYGIWEPARRTQSISARHLDLVITPLVAFDDTGNRIGMGAGYYDRCFSFLRHRREWMHPKLLGAAFECQRAPCIAAETWDIPLFAVATEQAMHRFQS